MLAQVRALGLSGFLKQLKWFNRKNYYRSKVSERCEGLRAPAEGLASRGLNRANFKIAKTKNPKKNNQALSPNFGGANLVDF